MRASGPSVVAALIGLTVFFPARPVAADPGAISLSADATVLATVDGDPVTARDLLVLLAQQEPPADPAAVASISADGLLKRLVQNRLLEQEGYRLGLDQTRGIEDQVRDVLRHQAMMALLDSVSSQVPDPDPVPTVESKPIMSHMFRASHILVDTEDEGRALLDSLRTGTPFAELAERHSLDTEWTDPDGDLGWAREDKFIPEFAAVLKDLPVGETGGPVRTEKGWHLLQLTETRTETLPQDGGMAEAARAAEKRDRVMKAVRAYVESLKQKYGVVPDESLLASLDYASADPQTLRDLQENNAVLAKLPWRDLTVSQLTRRIRFEHFHGLRDKPDAPQLRDRAFDEWVTELLLRHEAVELGFDKRPEVAASGEQMRRDRLREEVGSMILDVRFEPTAADVERYYRDHRDRFAPPPRIRATGVILSDEAAARRFRQRLEAGAQLGWLAGRTPEVIDPEPALFAGWLKPEELGLEDMPRESGQLVGPFEAGRGWAVARIVELEARPPLALEDCRAQVVGMMKSETLRSTMTESLARLEEQADVKMAEGAENAAQGYIDQWLAATPPSPMGGTGAHGGAHGGASPGAAEEATP